MRQIQVLIAADAGDVHGDYVLQELQSRNARAARLTAATLLTADLSWRPGEDFAFRDGQALVSVGSNTTVWWRRPGVASAKGLDALERQLVADEAAALLPGLLAAAGVRWVDSPWDLLRARLKILQLAVAKEHGVAIPDTMVTGDSEQAQSFAAERPIVAKAVSSGVGIAPYVDVVPHTELARVTECPTLLQVLVEAASDVRVVTIGLVTYVWTRKRRTGDPPDWRAADPQGVGFSPTATDPTGGGAQAVAQALSLSFSVQDWLIVRDLPVFLEVNAQGQWLFLSGADEIVVPALAAHLMECYE